MNLAGITMKRNILATVFILIALASRSIAQNGLEPERIDQFGRLPCDDLNGRVWNLVSQIEKLPGSRALIFVHPDLTKPKIANAQLKYMLAQFEFEGLENRIEIKIGREMDGLLYEFWKIPDGANPPDLSGDTWLPPSRDVTKPFIFGYEDNIGECPTLVPRKFAELLLANRGSRVHIVIKAGRWEGGESKGFADGTIKTLVEKFKVERKRIRTFYVRQKKANSMTYAEYWFVPARHNQIKVKQLK
jgi:hypothetical protein